MGDASDIEMENFYMYDDGDDDFCEGLKGCNMSEKENGNISEEECERCISDHNNYEY
jgi:hypothetical protein